jgi:hypothetical protein
MASLAEAKRKIARVINAQGIHSLNNPTVLGVIKLREQIVIEKLHTNKWKTGMS